MRSWGLGILFLYGIYSYMVYSYIVYTLYYEQNKQNIYHVPSKTQYSKSTPSNSLYESLKASL